MSRTTSRSGLALIRMLEGYVSDPVPMWDGHWLVGHGHVRLGGAGGPVSLAEAGELLKLDLAPIEIRVNAHVNHKLTQAQFDALVSFVLSIGVEAFSESQVLAHVNAGKMAAAACAMEAWRKSDAGGELKVSGALVRRRAHEKALFLKDAPNAAAPSAFLRAKLDQAALDFTAPPPARDPAQRLTEILQAEPATAALLLTQPIAMEQPVEEIVTAHARPVARTDRRARVASWLALTLRDPVTTIGLVSLLSFGLGLFALGALMLPERAADAIDILCATALSAPGLAAALVAAHGLWRVPQQAHA